MRRLLSLLLTFAAAAHGQCVTQTAAEYRRIADSLGGVTPYRVTLLDSAGIRVTDTWRSAGQSSVDGSVQWCRTHFEHLQFARATIALVDGSRPALQSGTAYNLLAVLDRPWLNVNDPTTWRGLSRDSVAAVINFGYPSWQAAVAALAPRFHDAAPPPVVVVPPPVVQPAPRTCDGHPAGYGVLTGGLSYDGRRTERTTIVKDGICLGVVTLASSSRYAIHIRTATGWRSPVQQFSSRAAAEAAIVAANGR